MRISDPVSPQHARLRLRAPALDKSLVETGFGDRYTEYWRVPTSIPEPAAGSMTAAGTAVAAA
jgi:hypothetical protein